VLVLKGKCEKDEIEIGGRGLEVFLLAIIRMDRENRCILW
jgi:hypothetical protein